jgi:NADH:ubiquinone oxidoreductase subunit 3 (subunit A)
MADVAISDIAPSVTYRAIVIFTVIAGVFVLGQFVILSMIKAKNNENENKHYRQHHQHQPNTKKSSGQNRYNRPLHPS